VPTFKLKESFLAARGEFLPHPETVKDVLITIKELARQGMTCILVTHEMGCAK